MSKAFELMIVRNHLRERRTMLLCFAPICLCHSNRDSMLHPNNNRHARLIEAVNPAEWRCDACRRTWTYEPVVK